MNSPLIELATPLVSIKSSIVKWLDIHLLIAHTHCFGSDFGFLDFLDLDFQTVNRV